MQDGLIALVRAHGQDAVTEPFDVLQQLFAVLAELGLHVVDERVRQHLRALDDHLVGVVIAVVAGLRKDGDRRLADRAATTSHISRPVALATASRTACETP